VVAWFPSSADLDTDTPADSKCFFCKSVRCRRMGKSNGALSLVLTEDVDMTCIRPLASSELVGPPLDA
jgi:hypothetical protein